METTDDRSASGRDLLGEAEQVGESLAGIAHNGERGRVNRALIGGLAEAGLLARLFRPEGISAVELCAIRQGLARTCSAAETTLAVQGLGSFPVAQSARPEVAHRWIPESPTVPS